jgi:endonuclease G
MPRKITLGIRAGLLTILISFEIIQAQTYDPGLPDSRVIIRHFAYILEYDEEHEQARWVEYRLTAEMTHGSWKRCDHFRVDPMIPTGSAEPGDYKGSGYDKGHLAPAADMAWDSTAMCESFYMSNMSPQLPAFNRGIWKRLEDQVRDWAIENQEVWIVSGPVLRDGLPTIGANHVSVPEYFYKVIINIKEPDFRGIGFILPNKGSKEPLVAFAVTIDSVEALTGLDFFPGLPDSLEQLIESSRTFSPVK